MKSDFRHLARRFIPRFVYQQLRTLADAVAVLRKEGLLTYLRIRSRDGNEITLHLKSLRHPFTIKRIASHVDGIVQNVMRGEYDAKKGSAEPSVIIDAGAFIGDLSCHWATLYPQARIICLEPNPDNYCYAKKNISHYSPNVTLMNKGLWSKPGQLSVAGDQMGSHLIATDEPGTTRVEVIDIPSLIREMELSHIDVLKLDIEGSERNVLNADSRSWLPLVKLAIVEMHGQDIEDEIVPHMIQQGFESFRYRSLVYFSRPEAIP